MGCTSSASQAAVSVPEAAVSAPEAAVSVPEAAVSVPEAAVSVPEAAVSVSEAAVSAPAPPTVAVIDAAEWWNNLASKCSGTVSEVPWKPFVAAYVDYVVMRQGENTHKCTVPGADYCLSFVLDRSAQEVQSEVVLHSSYSRFVLRFGPLHVSWSFVVSNYFTGPMDSHDSRSVDVPGSATEYTIKPWFHGAISRDVAVSRLQTRQQSQQHHTGDIGGISTSRVGYYLVRYSDSFPSKITVSVVVQRGEREAVSNFLLTKADAPHAAAGDSRHAADSGYNVGNGDNKQFFSTISDFLQSSPLVFRQPCICQRENGPLDGNANNSGHKSNSNGGKSQVESQQKPEPEPEPNADAILDGGVAGANEIEVEPNMDSAAAETDVEAVADASAGRLSDGSCGSEDPYGVFGEDDECSVQSLEAAVPSVASGVALADVKLSAEINNAEAASDSGALSSECSAQDDDPYAAFGDDDQEEDGDAYAAGPAGDAPSSAALSMDGSGRQPSVLSVHSESGLASSLEDSGADVLGTLGGCNGSMRSDHSGSRSQSRSGRAVVSMRTGCLLEVLAAEKKAFEAEQKAALHAAGEGNEEDSRADHCLTHQVSALSGATDEDSRAANAAFSAQVSGIPELSAADSRWFLAHRVLMTVRIQLEVGGILDSEAAETAIVEQIQSQLACAATSGDYYEEQDREAFTLLKKSLIACLKVLTLLNEGHWDEDSVGSVSVATISPDYLGEGSITTREAGDGDCEGTSALGGHDAFSETCRSAASLFQDLAVASLIDPHSVKEPYEVPKNLFAEYNDATGAGCGNACSESLDALKLRIQCLCLISTTLYWYHWRMWAQWKRARPRESEQGDCPRAMTVLVECATAATIQGLRCIKWLRERNNALNRHQTSLTSLQQSEVGGLATSHSGDYISSSEGAEAMLLEYSSNVMLLHRMSKLCLYHRSYGTLAAVGEGAGHGLDEDSLLFVAKAIQETSFYRSHALLLSNPPPRHSRSHAQSQDQAQSRERKQHDHEVSSVSSVSGSARGSEWGSRTAGEPPVTCLTSTTVRKLCEPCVAKWSLIDATDAWYYINSHAWEALRSIRALGPGARIFGSSSIYAQCLLEIGIKKFRLGISTRDVLKSRQFYEEARHEIQHAMFHAAMCGDRVLEIRCMVNVGTVATKLADDVGAIQAYVQSLCFIRELRHAENAYNCWSEEKIVRSNYTQLEIWFASPNIDGSGPGDVLTAASAKGKFHYNSSVADVVALDFERKILFSLCQVLSGYCHKSIDAVKRSSEVADLQAVDVLVRSLDDIYSMFMRFVKQTLFICNSEDNKEKTLKLVRDVDKAFSEL